MTNSTHQATWETYTASWAEADIASQLKLFEQSLSPDCVYVDPIQQASGYEQLAGYMAALQKNVPGARFVTTGFKEHHSRSLAHWNMVDGAGTVLAPGMSYAEYGADGRLQKMTGFYDPPGAP
ncbi:MAG TPA: nuclear transport factor 2 family protein [Burkholderiaceae bacterium]|nr:nuclear transport factor 2 family protein [Burkholderiaceae bacterium]